MAQNEMSECLDDNIIVEFIDGLLSAREIARVEHHAARCDSCRRLLAELGRVPTQEPLMRGYSATLPAGGVAHIDIQAGQELGRFVVLDRIGRGGMGVVFSAYDPKLDRKVAIKLLHSRLENSEQGSHDAQTRLLREAQAMAQLSHPNVISVYDVGTYKSEVYIAMEFVEGETLGKWILRWERSWQEILDKFVQAGKALADAHAASLVHRDFKPDNVLVGNDSRVRVMDFGLARWVLAESSGEKELIGSPEYMREDPGDNLPQNALNHSLTKTGALLGTPRYMAPEQFSGLTADARSDQFSFCVALYEALYQQHPFEDKTAYGLVENPAATQIRPPPPDSKVPAWLHNALLRGLATVSGERYPSMGALLRSLAPIPKPPSARRLMALIAVAIMSMGMAVYFYNRSDRVGEDLVVVEHQNLELEEQLQDLETEVQGLEEQLGETIVKLRQTRERAESSDAVAQELERELGKTVQRLSDTRAELVKTKQQLKQAQRRIATLRGTPVTTPPSLRGLKTTEIEVEINRYHRDFDVCLREWSERERNHDQWFAVRFQIDANGVPLRGSKNAGIQDQIVSECVLGLLEDQLRFAKSDGTTIARLGFRYENGGLRYTINVVDVVQERPEDGPSLSTDDDSE